MDARVVVEMVGPRMPGRWAASGPAQLACLAVIAAHEGEALSVETIAAKMRGSRSTAQRAIKALVANGIVRVEMGQGGVTAARRYFVGGKKAPGTRQ
jgi:DNA-binding IclR family transcriptional regulator